MMAAANGQSRGVDVQDAQGMRGKRDVVSVVVGMALLMLLSGILACLWVPPSL
jgi:hypothetical protein